MNRKEELRARSIWVSKEYCLFISFEDFIKYVWGTTEEYKEEENRDDK